MRSGGGPSRDGPAESSAAPGAPRSPCLGSMAGVEIGISAPSPRLPLSFVGGGVTELFPLPSPTCCAAAAVAASNDASNAAFGSVRMDMRKDRDRSLSARAGSRAERTLA